MNRDLVVVRCGRASHHPSWIAAAEPRTFDLFLCPYQDMPLVCDRPDLARTRPGQKWTGLHAFLTEVPVWREYDRIWLPDDDLQTTAPEIMRFFEACRRRDAAIAQPALTEDSQYSHLLTLRNRAFTARATTFVEVMAPCFRRDVLEDLLPTFLAGESGCGWGLDDAWGRLTDYRGIFVIDEVSIRHDRPVGAGRTAADERAVRREMDRVHRRFDARRVRHTLGGFDAHGRFLAAHEPGFLDVYLDGYRWLIERRPDARRRLVLDQSEVVPDRPPPTERPDAPWWRRTLGRFTP